MADYEFTTEVEVTAEAEIEVDITVQDAITGEEIDCDAEGYGSDITVSVDLSDLREQIVEIVKEELYEDIKSEQIAEIGNAISPMKALAEFILLVDNVAKVNKERTDDRLKDLGAKLRAFEIVVDEKNKEISTLTQQITDLNTKEDEVNAQKEDVDVAKNEVADNLIESHLTITPNTEEK